MQTILRSLLGLLLLMSTLALDAAAQTPAADRREPVTYHQLRDFLMDFADRYSQMISQSSDTLQKLAGDNPDHRTGIHSIKLFPCSAALSIAADADPQTGLLDMVVLVYLQGAVWKDGSLEKRYGAKAEVVLDAQRRIEPEIDAIALRVLTAEQLERLKKLVSDWRAAHPDQYYVSFIRFSDFADLPQLRGQGGGPRISIAGLLSAFQLVNVDEASRSVDQARMAADRALYLVQRMPTLMRWQAKMFFYEMVAVPEAKSLLETNEAIREFPSRFSAEYEKRTRALIWEAARACIVVLLAAFALAVLYRIIRRRI